MQTEATNCLQAVVGKLVPLQLDSQGRYVLLRCRTSHPRHFHCMDLFSHHAVGVQDITPLGSSTSSTRGGSTPFFTSPKGSTNLSTTPFASLSECPFTEADGPSTSGSPVPAPPPTKTQTQQQPRGPTVSFSSAQVDGQSDTQVGNVANRVKKMKTLCMVHGWQPWVYCNCCYGHISMAWHGIA